VNAALYAGDDVTDLDGFEALGEVEHPVRVGVRSDDGPAEIVERADLVVDGVEGMQAVLAELDAQ
jgi:trehalose 6-phosphate phosphatase